MAIAVVVDSASDLPQDLADQRGIRRIPLSVTIEGREYADGVDLPREKFWEVMASSAATPKTAAPSPPQFLSAFADAASQGADGVICLTMSEKLSATFQNANLAAKEFSGIPTKVIDTETLTLTEGLITLSTADFAQNATDLDAVVHYVESLKDCARTRGCLDTLDFLRRGGRIGSAAALMGTLMSFKPIIAVEDGELKAPARERTRRRALDNLLAWLEGLGPLQSVGVVHAQARDIDEIVSRMAEVSGLPVVTSVMGATIGSHAGPGAVGVCALTVETR